MTTPLHIHAVEHAGIMVADIAAAIEWYVDHLGFEVIDRWDNAEAGMSWAHLQAPGFRLEFVQRPGLMPADAPQAGIHHLALVVGDCQAATERVIESGGTVVFAPSYFERHDMDWSFVRDPFGNILELVAYRHTASSTLDPPVPYEGSRG